jgi:hypothetical protein
VSKEVRTLISRLAAENPTWGAPRIYGELLKLGFHLSETTVSRWLRGLPRTPDPAKRWPTFLRMIAHSYDESIRQSRKTIEMDPNFALAHNQLGQA